jgi:hypothetical protein
MTQTQKPIRAIWSRVPFVAVVVVLAAAATALNVTSWSKGLHFKKEPVPQPRDFHDLPALMGTWLQISQDSKLDPQTEEILNTHQYVYRDFIEVNQRGADLLVMLNEANSTSSTADVASSDAQIRQKFQAASFADRVAMIQSAIADKTPAERGAVIQGLQIQQDSGVVQMGLTYYTGMVDTVAHIPDRCYIADGYEPNSYDVPTWDLGNGQSLKVRLIAFDDVTGSNRVPKCVAYLFHVNGHYESDPLGVRQTLESLTQKYGYYAKIELMSLVHTSSNTDGAQKSMISFLAAAKPQIETCFPDWEKVTHSN